MRPEILFAVCVLAALTRSAAESQTNEAVAVVQPGASAATTTGTLRKELDARLLRSLPRSGTEVWQLDVSNVDRLKELQDSGALQHVEVAPRIVPAIPTESIAIESLPDDQRALAAKLVGDLSSSERYRISEGRPPMLSADLLESNLTSGAISINLPEGRTALFRRTKDLVRRGPGDFTWSGQQMGGPGSATLIVAPDGITGLISADGESYSITPIDEGRHVVVKGTSERALPEHPPTRPTGQAPPSAAAADIPMPCPASGTEADLLVVYTEAAKTASVNIEKEIQLNVDLTIGIMQASNTRASLRLVGTKQIAYAETNDIEKDLDAIRVLPEVVQTRDEMKADIVVAILSKGGLACGLAKKISADPATAFAVVVVPDRDLCPANRLSFTHEIGHLYGARHEDDFEKPFEFGHGFALTNLRVRDVMATDSSCDQCLRVAFYSNPDVRHLGQPMGNKDCCDNARVFREHTNKVLPRFRCRS